MVVTVWVIIAINLYAHLSIGHVMRKLARGLRFIWSDPNYRLPKASALTPRRYPLGARPLAALFRRLCRPMATPQTPGAFRFGLRLMAMSWLQVLGNATMARTGQGGQQQDIRRRGDQKNAGYCIAARGPGTRLQPCFLAHKLL